MKKVRLTELSKKALEKVRGGQGMTVFSDKTPPCGCACRWANQGGSSTNDNQNANAAGHLHSPEIYMG